jgi:hypothetical protein
LRRSNERKNYKEKINQGTETNQITARVHLKSEETGMGKHHKQQRTPESSRSKGMKSQRQEGDDGSEEGLPRGTTEMNPELAAALRMIREQSECFQREREIANERHEKMVEKLMELSSQVGGGSSRSGQAGDPDYIRREKAQTEASAGDWKSELLQTEDLPEDWPVYSWPKSWVHRHAFVRGLLAMRELQTRHTPEPVKIDGCLVYGKPNVRAAVDELGEKLRQASRFLKEDEFRIILPVKMKQEGDNYVFEHDVWELCTLGNKDCSVYLPGMMLVCRSVPPVTVASKEEWTSVTTGGRWPLSAGKGIPVGMYRPSKSNVQAKPVKKGEKVGN